ncbi:YafY family protein [Virgibacillus salarius]|uniref:helix-turn-helix transcriptional regulator n=1 Tax=Virgibacillus salarius TaxID=447199 RepID=UPI0031DCDAB0
MKKSERLNQMLRFVNQRQRFTLKDVINEFQISKRTALRDIASLEEMGVPLYAEYGRYGGYRLVKPITLPPISFSSQEVFALYFAMQALQSFTSTPFEISYRSVHEKFLEGLTTKQRKQIDSLQKRVAFFHAEQLHECAYLEELLLASTNNQILSIVYTTEKQTTIRRIQPISIYAMKGYWYCQSLDLNKKAYRVFRCDRIKSIEVVEDVDMIDVEGITIENAHVFWKPTDQAIPFKCEITKTGIEQFIQSQFPSMKIKEEHNDYYLVGTYEPTEVDFIICYLASFGKTIRIVEPVSLKEQLKAYYLDLINYI